MTSNIGITRAHTNIALIKYWGKENKELFIPMNSSLSLTLEAFYTDTKVELTDALTEDEFYLNGAKQDEAATAKITRFLDLFRAETGDLRRARVESLNFVPTAAGLASSASAFAALAGAMNEATSLHIPMSNFASSTGMAMLFSLESPLFHSTNPPNKLRVALPLPRRA